MDSRVNKNVDAHLICVHDQVQRRRIISKIFFLSSPSLACDQFFMIIEMRRQIVELLGALTANTTIIN